MKISTADLRQFKSITSHIKSNFILPICGYIKFGSNGITKTNLQQFAVIPGEYKEMLVEERMLYTILGSTNADQIAFEQKGNHVVISSEDVPSLKHQVPDISHFPSLPEAPEQLTPIDDTTMMAIATATQFTREEELPTLASIVQVGENQVMGTDKLIAYAEKTSFPGILVIPRSTALFLSKIAVAQYGETDNYDFFQCEHGMFGFVKSELKYNSISHFMKIPELPQWEANKHDLIHFCEIAIGAGVSTKCQIAHEVIKADDPDMDIHMSLALPSMRLADTFNFNAHLLIRLLKALPGDSLLFHRTDRGYFITDPERSFVSLIIGIVQI